MAQQARDQKEEAHTLSASLATICICIVNARFSGSFRVVLLFLVIRFVYNATDAAFWSLFSTY